MRKQRKISIRGLAYSASALAMMVSGPAFSQNAEEEPAEEVPVEEAAAAGETAPVEERAPVEEAAPAEAMPAAPEAAAEPPAVPEAAEPPEAPEAETEEEEEEEQVDISEDGDTASADQGNITVTGSRIKRDTYTSISPLQVLVAEDERNVGAFDPSQILQRTESAAGRQIDATFQGFVLDNGPGSQTINLRGLEADRTLVLLNGRRLAPAGVEGAPTSPSINLIPGALVDRYDILLDGASSIYGSDAVAGVVNVILRKDFDGLELAAEGNLNEQGGGNDYILNASWGLNTDRAFFGIGAEYSYRDEVKLRDRDFLRGCDTHLEEDQNGNRYRLGKYDNAEALEDSGGTVSVSESECKISGISGRIIVPFTRMESIYFPANGNIANVPGLPFGDSTNYLRKPLDSDGDGIRDVDFQNVNINAVDTDVTFISEQKLYNVFAYGEYTFPGEANITSFFEAQYTRARIVSDNTGAGQVFPYVPADNPLNPCNISGNNPNGVDCRDADNQLQGLVPGSQSDDDPLSTGFSLPVRPVFAIRGDRNNVDVTQEQYRAITGWRGDLPFIGSSWTFEAAGVYSRSEGSSIRRGIREDKLAFAIGLDPTISYGNDGVVDNNGDGIADDYNSGVPFFSGITPCDASALANPELAMPDLTEGCVPVNLFAPSVLGAPIGDFATAAERDYLFGVRSFDTTYEQILFSAFATGDLIELPAGPLGAVFGVEWRKDRINSKPDTVASNGLFFGFFADEGAVGSKWIREAFAELDIPLEADKPWVEELILNMSGRLTDEEIYGTAGTFSLKGGWRPISPLQFKFSYGTAFRAPNLRENFLAGQSGFNTLVDPCAVPRNAFNEAEGGYSADLDRREPNVLANCLREGRDPTLVGVSPFGTNTDVFASVETLKIGSLELDPETSRSLTSGMAFEETFGDGFDVSFSFNYYDIKVKDSIIEPSTQYMLNDCFERAEGRPRSVFCDAFSYGGAADRFFVTKATSSFLNVDVETVRGIDLNGTFSKDVTIGGALIDLGLEMRANHLIEASALFINEDGEEDFYDVKGRFGFPSWTGRVDFTAEYDEWLFTWRTRFIGSVSQDPDLVDPYTDVFGNLPDGTPDPRRFESDTCTGAGSANVPGDGRFCRDVGYANDYFVHSMSLRYRDDNFRIVAGITNLFDRKPPQIDTNEVFGISNTPIGTGYNLDGREFFASVSYAF